MKKIISLLSVFAFAYLCDAYTAPILHHPDALIMDDIKSALKIEHPDFIAWDRNPSYCSWEGVTCYTDGHVYFL